MVLYVSVKDLPDLTQIVAPNMFPGRIVALDGPDRRRSGKEDADPVLRDHAPEGPGIGRADRFALVQDGGVPVEQRTVDDVGGPDRPAEVGGDPVDVAGRD